MRAPRSPRAAKALAAARPTPELPPVTTTTRPVGIGPPSACSTVCVHDGVAHPRLGNLVVYAVPQARSWKTLLPAWYRHLIADRLGRSARHDARARRPGHSRPGTHAHTEPQRLLPALGRGRLPLRPRRGHAAPDAAGRGVDVLGEQD